MWVGQTGLANVISIATLEELCRKRGGDLSYYSETTGEGFVANLGNGEVVTFKRCPLADFPYIDLDDHCGDDGAVMLLQSVSKNMERYTKKEVQRAINACDTQAEMGYINEGDLKNEVSRKILSSSKITRADIANTNNIYGPNHHTIRGKDIRWKPTRV